MVRVSSCCCGCSLKTGAILIGVFYLVGYLIYMALVITLLFGIDSPNIKQYLKDQGIEFSEKDADQIILVTRVVLGVLLAIVILGALLNVLLIVGAVQERVRIIYTWLVVHVTILILGTVMVIVNGIVGATTSSSKTGSVIPTIINILLTIYFLVVVYSFYKELQEKNTARTAQPAAFNIEGYPMPPANAPPTY